MKFLALGVLLFSGVAMAGKPAILCKKGSTFEEAVGRLNSITIDQQWPLEINKNATGFTTTVSPKSVKFDMANFHVTTYEETVKAGKTEKKQQVFQACLPIDFD